MDIRKIAFSKKRISFILLSVVIIILVLAYFLGGFTGGGKVIARVGDEVITRHDVEVRIQQSLVRGASGGLVTVEALLFDRSLDDLITESMLFQDALKQGFVIDTEEVDRRYQLVRDNYDTEKEFLERMKANLTTPKEFRRNIGRQIVLFAYLEELKRLEMQEQFTQAILPQEQDGPTLEITVERIPVTGEDIKRLSDKRILELQDEIEVEVFLP